MERRDLIKAAGGIAAGGTVSGCLHSGSSGGGGSSGGSSAGSSGYTFMMSPSEPQTKMMAQYSPVASYLTDEMGGDVSLQYASSYSAIIRTLGSGNAQIAEMGPLAAVLGSNKGDAEISLQRRGYGSWTYSSVIVTREETDIQSLQDLEGRTIAFADTLSVSGSVYPAYMMQQAGLEVGNAPKSDDGAAFNGRWSDHQAAFEALMAGQADAAGVGKFITVKSENRDEYKEGVREVASTDGIPRAPISVSPSLSDEAQQQFEDAMINAPEDVYLGETDSEDDDLWFSQVRPASLDTYSSIVDVAQQLGIEVSLIDEAAGN